MSALDLDKLERGGEPPAPPPKPRSRKSSGDTRRRHDRPALELRIRESLEAIAGWVRDRGDEELGAILERDAGKMADVLGKVSKMNPLAKRAVSVVADVLEPVRAFGPTLRIVWYRFLERRAARGELEPEDEQVTPAVFLPGGPEPAEPEAPHEPEVAEPWRLAE